METAQQIRTKLTEMRLAGLQTKFCNTNWTYSLKLKALKEELHSKNRIQMELNAELAALKSAYAQHQNQIKNALAQAALLKKQEEGEEKSLSASPHIRETIYRKNSKNITKGLFFNVGRQENKKMYFSPNMSKTPATTSWKKLSTNNDQTRKNPEKSDKLLLLKEKPSLRSIGSEKTLESANLTHQNRGSGEITLKMEDRNLSGKLYKRRQENREIKAF